MKLSREFSINRLLITVLICLVALMCTQFVIAVTTDNQKPEFSYENEIVKILDVVKSGKIDLAFTLLDQHLVAYPTSQIANLIRADLLYAMSSNLVEIGGGANQKSNNLNGLGHQIRNRWKQSNFNIYQDELVPSSLVEIGHHKHVIVADLNSGRLYLYENFNGRARLLRDYYLTIGSEGFGKYLEGDNKTPIGVYSIYRNIPSSELPDLYGDGAYPVNYPNRFDRSQNRTGSGIWLHGTPSDTYARAPWASKGCFVLSNDDFVDIEKYISVKERTPVILSDSIQWVNRKELATLRTSYLSVLNRWKKDWESLNTEAYLSHYSREKFNFGKNSFQSWANKKREVNRAKKFVRVNLEIESLFIYPGVSDVFVVKYTQDYTSSNFSSKTDKQQYWQRNKQGRWKIIYEG